jgi:hypothetical protein
MIINRKIIRSDKCYYIFKTFNKSHVKSNKSKHVHVQSMIRYSHAMTCLMAYHNKKRTEAIPIVLQARLD